MITPKQQYTDKMPIKDTLWGSMKQNRSAMNTPGGDSSRPPKPGFLPPAPPPCSISPIPSRWRDDAGCTSVVYDRVVTPVSLTTSNTVTTNGIDNGYNNASSNNHDIDINDINTNINQNNKQTLSSNSPDASLSDQAGATNVTICSEKELEASSISSLKDLENDYTAALECFVNGQDVIKNECTDTAECTVSGKSEGEDAFEVAAESEVSQVTNVDKTDINIAADEGNHIEEDSDSSYDYYDTSYEDEDDEDDTDDSDEHEKELEKVLDFQSQEEQACNSPAHIEGDHEELLEDVTPNVGTTETIIDIGVTSNKEVSAERNIEECCTDDKDRPAEKEECAVTAAPPPCDGECDYICGDQANDRSNETASAQTITLPRVAPQIPAFVTTPEPCNFFDNPTHWIHWMEEEVDAYKQRKSEKQEQVRKEKEMVLLQERIKAEEIVRKLEENERLEKDTKEKVQVLTTAFFQEIMKMGRYYI